MAFITFEGPEGAGKSTQVALLATRLRTSGWEAVTTREPGGTWLGEQLRQILLDSGGPVSAEAEAYLMTGARAEHVRLIIRPALERGDIVLCDRFVDSTFAYQGGGRGLPLCRLRELQELALSGLTPDLTLLLDVPVEIGLSRRLSGGESNRIDGEAVAFHERVAAWYRQAAAAEPRRWRVIDATEPPAVVHTHVVDAVLQVIGQPICSRPEGTPR